MPAIVYAGSKRVVAFAMAQLLLLTPPLEAFAAANALSARTRGVRAASADGGALASTAGSREARPKKNAGLATRTTTGVAPTVPAPLLPARVTVTDAAAGPHAVDPWVLFDGRADRALSLLSSAPTTIEIRFGGLRRLDEFAVYGASDGVLSVYTERDGQKQAIDRWSGLSLSGLSENWARFSTPEPVYGDRLLLEYTPSGEQGLREVSFWGAAAGPVASADAELADRILAGSVSGAFESAGTPDQAEITRLGGARSFEATVEGDPRAFSRAFLVYELSGLGHWIGAERRINGGEARGEGAALPAAGGLQVEEISPSWLRPGKNIIEFLPASAQATPSYVVKNLRFVGVAAGGTHEALPLARRVEEGFSGPEGFQLSFDRPSEPHSMIFDLLRPADGKLEVRAHGKREHRQLIDLGGLAVGRHRFELDHEFGALQTLGFIVAQKKASEKRGKDKKVDLGPALSNVAVSATAVPFEAARRLAISYPLHGECRDGRAIVRGFIEGPDASAAELRASASADELRAGRDGSFELVLKEPAAGAGQPWTARIEAEFVDGESLSRSLAIGPCLSDPSESTSEGAVVADLGAPFGSVVRPNESATLSFAGATIEIPKGALAEATRITIRPLVGGQVRPMDRGMQNLVPEARAFRFGPHGLKFKKPVKISLPYDGEQIPQGLSTRDVHTFYFDEALHRWIKVGRFDEARHGELTSISEHFTDFVNATLAMPDQPGAKSFNPNELKDIELASPSAGVNVIEPPEANSSGAARLSHPIETPPGRNGVEPELSIAYNSDGQNGWLGVGWDLSVSSIEIDTRFGVPRYTGDETYLLEGEMLTPVGSGPFYRRRVEGQFQRIERLGDNPKNFSWVVTDKSGTRFSYGTGDNARLADPSADADFGDRIFRWYLERVEDTFGNVMTFTYAHDEGSNGEPFVQVYPARIDYTSHAASGLEAAYHVDFVLDRALGDNPSRDDVTISARSGFQVMTRYLLSRIDVRLGESEVIRSYGLGYRTGDFDKKLLETIGVHGLGTRGGDGVVTVGGRLYEHRFDYHEKPEGLFNDWVLWGKAKGGNGADRESDGLSRTKDSTAGGSGEVGIGIGPLSLTVGGGGFVGEDKVLLSMFDLTGDGLSELVDSEGNVSHNFLRRPSDEHLEFLDILLQGNAAPGLLNHTDRSGWNVKAGISFDGVAGVSGSYTRSTAEDDRLLADIDGDGRVDILDVDGGSLRGRRSKGEAGFAAAEEFDAVVQGDFPRGPQELVSQVGDTLHPLDALLRWNAPFGGSITITGALQKREAGGDGVRAEIYHNETLLWSRAIGPDDLSVCTPGPSDSCAGPGLNVSVGPTDRIYTRLKNRMDDTIRGDDTFDEVLWNPTITYGVSSSELELREPHGPRIYQFSQAVDHRLAGRPEMPFVAAAEGDVRLEGALVKFSTSDEVRVEVFHENQNGVRINDIVPLTVLGAGDAVLPMPTGLITVQPGDTIRLQVSSDVPIDPARVIWAPTITYQRFCRLNANVEPAAFVCGAVSCAAQPDGSSGCNIDGDPTPDIPIPFDGVIQHQAQVYFRNIQLLPLTATQTVVASGGTATIAGAVQKVAATLDPVTVVVQGVHELHFKHTFAANELGAVGLSFPVSVEAGEQLFFTVFSDSDPSGAVSASATVNGNFAPFNVRYRDASFDAEASPVSHEPLDPLSGGFHRWFTGQWNGNFTFDEDLIEFPQPQPINPVYFTVPRRQGLPDVGGPLWVSTNSDGYIGAGIQNPSRVGKFARLRGHSAGGGDIDELRSSETWNAEVNVQLSIANVGVNVGATTTDLDFLDLNGDRFPDSVTRNGVVLHQGNAALIGGEPTFGVKQGMEFGFDELRRVEHRSVHAGVGLDQTLINQTDSRGQSKALLSTGFHVGIDYGYSAGHIDIADINGDGLPDHIRKKPRDGSFIVHLNLGDRFSGPIEWASSAWSRQATVSGSEVSDFMGALIDEFSGAVGPDVVRLQDSAGLGVGASIGAGDIGAGGGYTYSVTRTFVDLVDINGDGLPDQVMKMPDENVLYVKLNHGDAFGPLTPISIPPWAGIPNFDPESYVFSGSADAVAFRRAKTFTGNVSVKVCFIVCVGASGFYSEGTGWSQLEFDDIDGDGKVDHVLKIDGDPNVYAKLNKTGKSNLLSSVTRPLGGSFTLDYRRAGNLVDPGDEPQVDMPNNQWVLANVVVADGRGNSYRQDFLYGEADLIEGGEEERADREEGFFDRIERENYGYGTVTTFREDSSTVTTHSHNHDYYRRGLVRESIEADADGNLFTRQTLVHRDPGNADLDASESPGALFSGTFFPAELRRETFVYEGQTSDPAAFGKQTAEHRGWDLSNGNLEAFTDEGDVGTEDDVFYDIDYHQEAALNVHKANLVVGTDSAGNVLRKRTATYFAGSGALETLTNVVIGGINPETGQPYTDDSSTNSTWSFTYDQVGNLDTATDPGGFVLDYGYDELTQTYRTSISDSFGYSSSTVPNHLFGTMAEVTDVNGHVTEFQFDEFGRLSEIFGPTDDAEPSLRFDYGLQADDPAPPFPAWARTQHTDFFHPGDPIVTVTFIDGIDRVIQSKKDLEKDDGTGAPPVIGMSVSGTLVFDARGRVQKQGQPTFETVSPDSHSDDSSALVFSEVELINETEFEYDIMSRMRQVTTPEDLFDTPSVTTTAYGFGELDGVATLTTTVTDPNENVRVTHRDVDESVVGVVEFNRVRNEANSTELTTRYSYNPLDELVTVEDALGNETTAQYDTVGRMVSLTSPDMGKTEWRYDRSGNLAAKQTARLRARNQLIGYEYDFNRLRKVNYPDGPGVEYTYGTADESGDENFNRAGRIVTELSEAGRQTFQYDRFGNVTRLEQTFERIRTPSLGTYTSTMGYVYEPFGRLVQAEFPGASLEIVTYGYDRGGLVTSARGEITGTPPLHAPEVPSIDYFTHIGYDEFEQRVRLVYGNGIDSSYVYYPKTRRLQEVNADQRDPRLVSQGLPPRPFQRLEYTYDRVGNIVELRNNAEFDDEMQPVVLVATTSQTFDYDDLYQLKTADGTYQDRGDRRQRYSLTFEYDEISRILLKDQLSMRDVPDDTGGFVADEPDKSQTYRSTYVYDSPTRVHAPTRIDEQILNGPPRSRRFSYDESGNQTGWVYHKKETRDITWNAEDRVRKIDEKGVTLSAALYDGDGGRAVHLGYSGQEETAYLSRDLTFRNGVYPSKHIYAGQQLIASKLDPEWFAHPPTLYFHSDHLGSAQFATNDQQDLTQHDEFLPTGEVWETQTDGRYSNRRLTLFTGKELDPGVRLYYFGARWYDPRQSQWISPDPVLAEYMQGRLFGGVYSPRQLGLYAYAWNNPTRFKDQQGEFVNFIIGAAIAAGIDTGVQLALMAAGKQDKFDGWSVLVSAGAGAAGVGIASALTKAKHLSTAAKVAGSLGGDAAVSAGSKAAKGEEVTLSGVGVDVALGQAGGKALGKLAKGKAEKSSTGKLLEKSADRAERVAKPDRHGGARRPGRQKARERQAQAARAQHEQFVTDAEVRGSVAGSNAASKVLDVATKKDEKKGRRLTPKQRAAVAEFNRLYGPDDAPPPK